MPEFIMKIYYKWYNLSGCDWRRFAQRVGVSQNLIDAWQEMKLRLPAGQVLTEWSSQPEATVRMLHRHIMSPQMKFTILGKRIADFYDVN